MKPNKPNIGLSATPGRKQGWAHMLSPIEAAIYIHVSVKTLAKWRSNGLVDLPWVKIGGRVFYRLEDLNRFINAHVVDPANGGAL